MKFKIVMAMTAFAPFIAFAADGATKPAFTQDRARSIVRELQKVVTHGGIDQQLALDIGGTKQWITIRGRYLHNPILLFIHGGPGAPEMPTSWTFENPWEDYFTVVQWDQRGSGKTYAANDPEKIRPTVTAERMERDAQEVVQYLRATYHKDKVFVMAHSWGTLLGLELAKQHPEWLYAYVGMGQMIDSRESERLGYENTLKDAEAAHNEEALRELRAIAPYPEADGSIPLDKINTNANGR
jgi:proline iminopeptidase